MHYPPDLTPSEFWLFENSYLTNGALHNKQERALRTLIDISFL